MISSKSAYIARFLVIRRDGERLEEFPLHTRRLMDIANEISESASTLEDDPNVIQWKLDRIPVMTQKAAFSLPSWVVRAPR